MSHDAPTPHRPAASDAGVFSLASLLGVLWRRRWLVLGATAAGLAAALLYLVVTKPLYQASATVRPGITNYTAAWQPERGWQLKDIVRWYSRGMYGSGVKEKLGLPERSYRPDILADFIPRGVGTQGGDVVTLTTLSPSRQQAGAILETSIALFNEYAEINSVGNSLSLSRKSLQNEIDKLQNDRADIAIKRDLLNLMIDRKRQELEGVAMEQKKLELRIQEFLVEAELRQDKAASLDARIDVMESGLQEMAYYLERMKEKERLQDVGDTLFVEAPLPGAESPWLPDLVQDKTSLAGRLLLSTLEARSSVYEDRLEALDLRSANRVEDLKRRQLLLEESYTLRKKAALLESEIKEMEINRDRALEQELVKIADDVRVFQSRLEVLTPLEQIGTIMVTERPVRPRKLRVLGLLTAAGLLGGLSLAVGWDYLSRHRDEILRNPPARP
ncbi:MAG: hypothetical protein IPM94_15980 [bacterium]|nr:hypothetical protein [bacterium]